MRSSEDLVKKQGFSFLEVIFSTVILLAGLVMIAQLVPISISMNYRNRVDSSAVVLAQRELDEMLAQPLTLNSFTDTLVPPHTCSLGNPAQPNQLVPAGTVAMLNGQTIINFAGAPVPGYSFIYTDPNLIGYDVRWAVIITGNGSKVSSKRFIVGVRQQGGDGYVQPVTLDAVVAR